MCRLATYWCGGAHWRAGWRWVWAWHRWHPPPWWPKSTLPHNAIGAHLHGDKEKLWLLARTTYLSFKFLDKFFLFLILIMNSLRVSSEIGQDRSHIKKPSAIIIYHPALQSTNTDLQLYLFILEIRQAHPFYSFSSFVITCSAIGTLKASYTLLIFFSSKYAVNFFLSYQYQTAWSIH